MRIADTDQTPSVLQTSLIPKCVYCSTAMTRRLKDTLTKTHYWLFECKDCGWEVVLPTADDAKS